MKLRTVALIASFALVLSFIGCSMLGNNDSDDSVGEVTMNEEDKATTDDLNSVSDSTTVPQDDAETMNAVESIGTSLAGMESLSSLFETSGSTAKAIDTSGDTDFSDGSIDFTISGTESESYSITDNSTDYVGQVNTSADVDIDVSAEEGSDKGSGSLDITDTSGSMTFTGLGYDRNDPAGEADYDYTIDMKFGMAANGTGSITSNYNSNGDVESIDYDVHMSVKLSMGITVDNPQGVEPSYDYVSETLEFEQTGDGYGGAFLMTVSLTENTSGSISSEDLQNSDIETYVSNNVIDWSNVNYIELEVYEDPTAEPVHSVKVEDKQRAQELLNQLNF